MMKGMMNRKIPKEILAVFEKYLDNNVRHLERKEAIKMLRSEFALSEEDATQLFETFDKDKNEIMSIWEFQQFYVCMGAHATQVVQKFHELDVDGSGKLDPEEAREGLAQIKTATDRLLDAKEIDFFLETTAGEDGLIDLGAFTNLLYRLKLYNAPPPPKNAKIGVSK